MGHRIMTYILTTIMSWVWLGIKLILLLLVVQLGFFVNSYGWESAIRNAGWIGGIGWGLLEDLINQNQGGQQRQPRGTRRRAQNNYGYDDQAYGQGQGRGRGGYGYV